MILSLACQRLENVIMVDSESVEERYFEIHFYTGNGSRLEMHFLYNGDSY